MMLTQDSNVYAQSIIDFLKRTPLNVKNSLLIFKGFQLSHLRLPRTHCRIFFSELVNNIK